MPENYYNPDYQDEDLKAVDNWGQFDLEAEQFDKLVPPPTFDKRHVGAVAALSGQKDPSVMGIRENQNLRSSQPFNRVAKSISENQ